MPECSKTLAKLVSVFVGPRLPCLLYSMGASPRARLVEMPCEALRYGAEEAGAASLECLPKEGSCYVECEKHSGDKGYHEKSDGSAANCNQAASEGSHLVVAPK